jgi:phage gp37-like protein
MKRMAFYDPTTGAILHTHQECTAVDAEPAEPDEETVAALLERVGAPAGVRWLTVEEPPVSSSRAARWIDVGTGKLVSERLQPQRRED